MSSSAKRALLVLDIIGRSERPFGVTEIARLMALPPGTVFRSLDALMSAGLVARFHSSSRYILGEAAERLHRSLIGQFRLRDIGLPYLRQLASLGGETATLHVRLGWYCVRVASVPGASEVTHAPSLGEAYALAETYQGRAILAFLGKDEIARYRAWADAHDRAPSKADRLRLVRERGFDMERTPFGGGGKAVAVPIQQRGTAIAAIAIEGPVIARAADTESDILGALAEAASKIEAMGRRRPDAFQNPFAHLEPGAIVL